jgi:hypothetical protein
MKRRRTKFQKLVVGITQMYGLPEDIVARVLLQLFIERRLGWRQL